MPTADELIGPSVVRNLADRLTGAAPGQSWSTVRASAGTLAGQAFGERGRAVRDALLADLPPGYPPVEVTVRAALKDPAFAGWMIWPVTEAVAVRALNSPRDGDFEAGLALLADLTPRLTAEFALRSFLNADLDRTLATVTGWTTHPDPAVRRLASEGTRPRLPWARSVPEIKRRPAATVGILDALVRDPSDDVRRSVANHLNDVSRLDPELAVATATRWSHPSGPTDPPDPPDPTMARLVRHALRTLVKQADPGALTLLGFRPLADVAVDGPRLAASTVTLGGDLRFDATVVNHGRNPARVAIDYVLWFQKANGTLAPKVFKLTIRTLAPDEKLDLTKRHSFRPITTRVHYPGAHAIELQINGTRFHRTPFTVI